MGKKNPYVFTIGFDKKNPEHLEVVEILNGTEKKAALIAEAILQYAGKRSGGNTGVSQESIQAMVRLLVRQEMERIAGEAPVSNFQTCRAACPPYVVPALRHKQCLNPASL